MSQYPTLFRCSLVGTLLVPLAAQHAAANVTNANFFYMPSFSEPVPSAIAGDTLNVSWSSNYAEGVLMVHCNDVQVSTVPSLASEGTKPIVIQSQWDSPRHFQFGIADAQGWFDSGKVAIVDDDRDVRTWRADGSCSITSVSGSAATATPGSTTSANAAAIITVTGTCEPKEDSGPGMGAGVGIGIGISAGAAAIPALLQFLRRRKRIAAESQHSSQSWGGHYNNQDVSPIVEIQGRSYNELPGQSNLIELDGQGQRK